jgi:hypothetical protein
MNQMRGAVRIRIYVNPRERIDEDDDEDIQEYIVTYSRARASEADQEKKS